MGLYSKYPFTSRMKWTVPFDRLKTEMLRLGARATIPLFARARDRGTLMLEVPGPVMSERKMTRSPMAVPFTTVALTESAVAVLGIAQRPMT
jgi:hypothetical protein